MQNGGVLDHVQIEVIGTSNPLIISMSNHKNIIGVELEQFHFDPVTSGVNLPPKFMGIKATGTRGRYNEYGYQNEVLRTLSQNPTTGGYHWESSGDQQDSVRYINNGTDLVITFIDRNVTPDNLNPPQVVFDNNYLLNISLLLE